MKKEMGKLLLEVEKKLGKTVSAATDFDKMASRISRNHTFTVTGHALKTIWGFISTHEKPSKHTLDRLSIFVGYQDWDSFQEALSGEVDGQENYTGEKHHPSHTEEKKDDK